MRKYLFLLALCVINFLFAQQVTFNEIEKVVENNEQFLFRIYDVPPTAVYLAEIEIVGAKNKPDETFRQVLSKSKEVGANFFAYKPFDTIDESITPFDANHFLLSLYYIPESETTLTKPVLFLFSMDKKQKIRVNETNYDIEPKSFIALDLTIGMDYEISTRKFLGTTLKFRANNESKYILCEKFNVKANDGLSLKSGDLISLDKSFGNFLTILYAN